MLQLYSFMEMLLWVDQFFPPFLSAPSHFSSHPCLLICFHEFSLTFVTSRPLSKFQYYKSKCSIENKMATIMYTGRWTKSFFYSVTQKMKLRFLSRQQFLGCFKVDSPSLLPQNQTAFRKAGTEFEQNRIFLQGRCNGYVSTFLESVYERRCMYNFIYEYTNIHTRKQN